MKFYHSLGDSSMIFISHCVTLEDYWQIIAYVMNSYSRKPNIFLNVITLFSVTVILYVITTETCGVTIKYASFRYTGLGWSVKTIPQGRLWMTFSYYIFWAVSRYSYKRNTYLCMQRRSWIRTFTYITRAPRALVCEALLSARAYAQVW